MNLKKVASMLGEFTDRGPKLYSEKVAGNVCACMGFVADSYTKLNVPNTLLKKDIRDVSSKSYTKALMGKPGYCHVSPALCYEEKCVLMRGLSRSVFLLIVLL